MNLATKTNGGFAQGILLLLLSSILEHSGSLCVPEGTVTATRVGNQQSTDPHKGNATENDLKQLALVLELISNAELSIVSEENKRRMEQDEKS